VAADMQSSKKFCIFFIMQGRKLGRVKTTIGALGKARAKRAEEIESSLGQRSF
jgi:hypothetical protein